MRKRAGVAALAAAVAALSGCWRTPHHTNVLIFGTNTKIALDVSYNPQNPADAPNLTIGYDRQEVAWIPLMANNFTNEDITSSVNCTVDCTLADGTTAPTAPTAPTATTADGTKAPTATTADGTTAPTAPTAPTATTADGTKAPTAPTATTADGTKATTATTADGTKATTADGTKATTAKCPCGMFQGERSGVSPERRMDRDTYSVLAILDSDLDVENKRAKAGIAQYFATGLAARALAEKSGAAAVTVQDANAADAEARKAEAEAQAIKYRTEQISAQEALDSKAVIALLEEAKPRIVEAVRDKTDPTKVDGEKLKGLVDPGKDALAVVLYNDWNGKLIKDFEKALGSGELSNYVPMFKRNLK